MTAPRAVTRHAATGRSFLVIIVVATAVSLAVALWTLRRLTNAQRARGAPATFRL